MTNSSIRTEAPIPGKSAFGIEIPNRHGEKVCLRELLECDEFVSSKSSTVVPIGKDIAGKPVFGDIAKFPHALVSGISGMGKSTMFHSIITSILYKAEPRQVKLILIDPKKVEFTAYNGIPHLLVPVITEASQAVGALAWAVAEMERRYDILEGLDMRNVDAYNEKQQSDPSVGECLPKIVIVIDELNDLMIQVKDPLEDLIMLIAQKARAAGIHLIIGTQCPDRSVITGVIKANINTRISFKVASAVDSRTILETAGAEKLLSQGDMLYKPQDTVAPIRVQGAFVSCSEIRNVTEYLKNQYPDFPTNSDVLSEMDRLAEKYEKKPVTADTSSFDLSKYTPVFDCSSEDSSDDFSGDRKFLDAVELVIKEGKASTAFLQRKLNIGFSKAAGYMDQMEELEIVGSPEGSKPRRVLITAEEWRERYSRVCPGSEANDSDIDFEDMLSNALKGVTQEEKIKPAVAVLLAEGFEELEALTPVDILRRELKDKKIMTVGVRSKTVTGAHGIKVEADATADTVDLSEIEAVIFPGGMPGAVNLDESPFTDEAIEAVTANGGLLCAICAAPMIFGKRGLLEGKEATCFPGFEDKLTGAVLQDRDVVKSGNIITARNFRSSCEFADTIVKAIK